MYNSDMTTEHEQQLGQVRVEFRDFQEEVNRKLDLMKDNHLAHMQASMNQFQIDFVSVKNDVSWLLRFFWIVAGVTVTNMFVNLFA
jgi:hypothetical protein